MNWKWVTSPLCTTVASWLAVLIALLTLIISISPAVLSFSILASQPLVDFQPGSNHRLQLHLDGEEVVNPIITEVRFENIGYKAIRSDSYNEVKDRKKGLLLELGDSGKLIAADIKYDKSSSRPAIKLHKNLEDSSSRSLIIEPFSLNTSDKIEIQLITSGDPNPIKPLGYITDCSILNLDHSPTFDWKTLPSMILAILQMTGTILIWCWTIFAAIIVYITWSILKAIGRFFEPSLESKVKSKVQTKAEAVEILATDKKLLALAQDLKLKKPQLDLIKIELKKIINDNNSVADAQGVKPPNHNHAALESAPKSDMSANAPEPQLDDRACQTEATAAKSDNFLEKDEKEEGV